MDSRVFSLEQQCSEIAKEMKESKLEEKCSPSEVGENNVAVKKVLDLVKEGQDANTQVWAVLGIS